MAHTRFSAEQNGAISPPFAADGDDMDVTTFFVSRHPGALEWLLQQGIDVDHYHVHLDPREVTAGDIVIGTLPIHIAADITAKGADYWHLSLNLPVELRGCELTAELMAHYGARLERFGILRLSDRL
ncbi:CRISPR-associated protein Csx16 [Halomonas lysinitropha]|uniref:CRISPR-associated protein (Cas_VVA1548) n=1 Tax=Halomonas lysinitropha TaxID=2607506 RepID=A0A5K1I9W8_9GAMM|nr:CRISPR-associated protein Csx16 [Halomonas lysinitropha]VVZ94639.1 Putative CRISPR-associated protein (Cas_VVA1548) [Halomonas lysinitropha]